jgi:glycosyltransferase involved in cell wall biosynthesis
MPEISVIICAHNPQPAYLRRVLDALKSQSLPTNQWELLLIDNASNAPLASTCDLSWHPLARHIREDELGLTPARLRGIKESQAALLVFVDDDNVLQSDFLANSLQIAADFPFLGAWGGNVEGDFEGEIPDWLKPHLHALAVREVDRDYWSNYYADNRSMPFGAGFCVRKLVATAYARALVSRPASKNLGRKGASLVSGEDIDMALTAYDSGFGTGLFRKLRTTHIIPKGRMTLEYLCRLLEGIEYSTHLLRKQRNANYFPPQEPTLTRWVRAYQVWRLPDPIRSIAKAQNRGQARAMAEFSAGS